MAYTAAREIDELKPRGTGRSSAMGVSNPIMKRVSKRSTRKPRRK
jgi:hypothetical protein